MTLHADELPVDEVLVRRLIAGQLPTFAQLPVRRLPASGSSNALFRLGDDLLVRVPRQPGGSTTILKEARWLPVLRTALPVQVPEVVAVGEPAQGYPEHWSVTGWIVGAHPSVTPPGAGSPDLRAEDLAAVVGALRRVEVPDEAREDPDLRWYRSGSLAAIDADVRAWIAQCRSIADLHLDLDAVLSVWDAAVAAAVNGPATRVHWLHGDLLAENLLVRDGRLVAVLDFGGLAVGDPTVDLVAAWELLDPGQRARFRAEAAVDDRTWTLGRAWALALAVMTFPYYWGTMPGRCADRLSMARRALADDGASDPHLSGRRP